MRFATQYITQRSGRIIMSADKTIKDIDEIILEKRAGVLKDVCNASELTNDEYALVRKDYLGASDSSILCGVNLYKNLEELVIEKNTRYITDQDREIGNKPAVRKGRDLEPLILRKFEEAREIHLAKPKLMYSHVEFPYLATNFDGVIEDILIPVEAKFVTRYGERYYNKTANEEVARQFDVTKRGPIAEHIKFWADKCGIPAYYYTQVQQQIFFLGSDYGYLCALFEESWDFKIFYIPRDEYTISHIISAGDRIAQKMNRDETSL